MDELRISERPELRRPILIAAFAGWNDAGESATSALRFVLRRWRAQVFAEIDPDPFYDFTQTRPRVRLEQGERVLDWPPNRFAAHRLEDRDFDVILLQGTEPHMAWRSYLDAVMEICRQFDVSALVTLGALLAEVSHTRPVPVRGTSPDPALRERMKLDDVTASRYEGPTGIVGVLSQAAREAQIPTASLWASVPMYINASPNPKGALALLQQLNASLDFDLTLHDLEVFGARFDAQVAETVAKDPEMRDFAGRIAERELQEEPGSPAPQEAEGEPPDPQAMVEEIERFLREQRGDDG